MKIAVFTGPRQIGAEDEKLVRAVVREVLARGFTVYVGDALGVDAVALSECITHSAKYYRVFRPIESLGRSPAGLAERSTRMVKEALRDAYTHRCSNCGEKMSLRRDAVPSAIICRCGNTKDWPNAKIICIGFPNKPCPAGIVPAKSWRSGTDEGSGTWSTLALAVGHEIETWIFPLGKHNELVTWDHWDYRDFGKTLCAWHFEPTLNLFPALGHEALVRGWTELARANSANGN